MASAIVSTLRTSPSLICSVILFLSARAPALNGASEVSIRTQTAGPSLFSTLNFQISIESVGRGPRRLCWAVLSGYAVPLADSPNDRLHQAVNALFLVAD